VTEKQVPIKEFIVCEAEEYQELLPNVGNAYEALTSEVYIDGALDSKSKEGPSWKAFH
jgi:hypothetical protein